MMIEWNGGERPVWPGTEVRVKFSDGLEAEGHAHRFNWTHVGGKSDIVAYEVVKYDQAEGLRRVFKRDGHEFIEQLDFDKYKPEIEQCRINSMIYGVGFMVMNANGELVAVSPDMILKMGA